MLIAMLPLLSFYVDQHSSRLDFKTLLVGLAAALAIIFRVRSHIPFGSVARWRESLSLTHVAFAIGCIPTLIILLVSPEALFQLEIVRSDNTSGATPSLSSLLLSIAAAATWAALTEEFIYRGLLISVFRRWRAISSPAMRDALAVFVSALVFGLAHLPSWGPLMSVALFGLGIGFGIAYLAVGELLLPLIVYHLIFDIMSLSFAIFGRSI
jgi:membrane protease YdiL (CAAX protease family)